ncbi:MAG: thioredoxin family protein [Bacilli bacterium]|nr:thioredoxin family protein [Bacilli bacterium]
MNENKKVVIAIAIIMGSLFLLILIGLLQKDSGRQEDYNDENTGNVTYSGKYTTDYEKAFEGDGKKVLFIGSSSCGVCSEFTPYMKYLSEAYDFTYYYIDAATMNTNTLESVLEKVGKTLDNIGTPYMAFIENGEKYDEVQGYLSESGLFSTLQKKGIIDENEEYISSLEASKDSSSNNTDEYQNLTFIDYDEYQEIYESKEKSIIVIGQTGCGACTSFKPIINDIAKEYNITIYFVNLTDWTKRESYDLMSSLSYFKDRESFGTPLMLILENGDNIGEQEGYNKKDTTIDFLRNQGFIKES